MALRALVESQVKFAFKAIGDLAINVTLTKRNVSGFNFGTGAVVAGAQTTKVVKAVQLKRKKGANIKDKLDVQPNSSNTCEILCMSPDVSDVSQYDIATFNNIDWKIVHPAVDDGYTSTISLAREG